MNHRLLLEGEPRALVEWAKATGPYTAKLIHWHLVDRKDAHTGLRSAQRLRRLCEDYGASRFEEACAYALARNIVELRSIQSVLRSRADKYENNEKKNGLTAPIDHENLRGPEYYGGE